MSTGHLHDDITNDITDIPHDLELNQEDFSDVLPRLPDDLQDFDIFEGAHAVIVCEIVNVQLGSQVLAFPVACSPC